MSISQALNNSLSGLRATQAGLALISSNVANAQTAGYVRKSLQLTTTVAGDSSGSVRVAAVNRELDQYLQRQLRVEAAGGGYADLRAEFYTRLQGLYGSPGSDSSLETTFNNFTSAVQSLVTSPDSTAARSVVLSSAQVFAQTLNSLSSDIQGLRSDAENGLADSVSAANNALQKITQLNGQLSGTDGNTISDATLLDQRDQYIDQLSSLIDIRVITNDRNQVTIFTNSGVQLVGAGAAQLSFTPQGTITPQTVYDPDPAKNNVGSLKLIAGDGTSVDLIADKSIRSGKIAAYLDLRDNVLVQAQNQIDALAATAAQALSSVTVDGTATPPGPPNGFELDTTGLLDGNRLNLTYTDASNIKHQVSIIRVDDPAALPLNNSATADPNDEVFGVSFSGGLASVVSQLNAQFGGSLTFSNPSGNTLEVLDDGGVSSTANAFSLTRTSTALADGDPALSLFTDGAGAFTGSISSLGSQTTGFAARIAVNPALLGDPSKLTIFGAGTAVGDPTRPNQIYDSLTKASFAFSAKTGLGNATTPYTGNIQDYLRQVLSSQGQAASNAQHLAQGQDVVVNALQQRANESSGVNIDQELASLISLQTAYGANARVLSAVRDLIDTLLKS